MRRSLSIALALIAISTLASNPAKAYYFFTHYTLRNAPYNPVPEKFDLTTLPNKTVTFFVSDNGPVIYSANDSFASVLSQIRQATQAWNSVATSDLRVAFGGVFSNGTPQNTPGGQVVFVDLPPGVYGYGGPVSRLDISASSTGGFFPIQTSLVQLSRDLTRKPNLGDGPSYSDTFFLSTVHEVGHALGLQHTFTSSAMSQATTRSTLMTRPVDADDVAGLSVLYPNSSFAGQFGSITGRVLYTNGQPVHMASVVAIRSGASAVSGYTNPDGSFRIDGIPPGSYFVYAHPLPPTANVVPPLDPSGNTVNGSGPFSTSLYPGTSSFAAATPVQVSTAATTSNINFAVSPRALVPLYDISVTSYFNNNSLQPAFLNENNPVGSTAAAGTGLGSNGVANSGLGAQILGGGANIYATQGYGDGQGNTYFAMYLQFALGGGTGPQHVIFTLPDYIHVLPNAVNLVLSNPPSITSTTSNSDGSLTIAGTNFASDSRFYLDGAPLTIRSLDPVGGNAVVVLPTGSNGQHATLCVLNSDGQNSFFAQPTLSSGGSAPATYAYPAASTPALTAISPASIPAGAEAMVDITGANTNFSQGQTSVGFGSSDVYVRRVFVLSSTHLQVDVYIPPGASQTATEVSVTSGFQTAIQPNGFQITQQNPRLPVTSPLVVNALPGQAGIYPGAIVSVFGQNLSANGATPVVTIGGQVAAVAFASATQINLQIPFTLAAGPASMNLFNGALFSLPVVINIDPAPAAISSIVNGAGAVVDSNHPLKTNDIFTILLSNFADPSASVSTTRVQVSIGGVSVPAMLVAPAAQAGLFQVLTTVPAGLAPGIQPVLVYLDGHSSTQAIAYISQ